MKSIQEIQKTAMRELAWRELIQAVKPMDHPKQKLTVCEKDPAAARKQATHHPAIITNQEIGRWELFG